jgi:hypothetical protein
MSEFISVSLTKRIARPVDVVRSQFFDMEHHVRANVHDGVRFNILSHESDRCRFTQELRILGMKQKDEVLLTRDRDGNVTQEFITGLNAGGRIEVRFSPDGDKATRVDAIASVPKRGIKRLLAPLFKIALTQIGTKLLEEDRRDLEERNYQPRS